MADNDKCPHCGAPPAIAVAYGGPAPGSYGKPGDWNMEDVHDVIQREVRHAVKEEVAAAMKVHSGRLIRVIKRLMGQGV